VCFWVYADVHGRRWNGRYPLTFIEPLVTNAISFRILGILSSAIDMVTRLATR